MADELQLIPPGLPEPAVKRLAPLTPMELLDRALERGDDLSVLEKLMDLQDRHETRQARKAFDAAVGDAKADIPVIKKNRTGHNNKAYADLSAFADAVAPVLAKHGLNYRFRSRQEGAAIFVTCVLSHRDGHSEETTLSGAADTSGNKNSIQAVGSTLTYLQRYSLTLALGLAASEDDDGQAAGGNEAISEEQAATIRKRLGETESDIAKFCDLLKVESIAAIRQRDYAGAMAVIDAKAKKKAPK